MLFLECGDMSPLSLDATCRVVPKRSHACALHSAFTLFPSHCMPATCCGRAWPSSFAKAMEDAQANLLFFNQMVAILLCSDLEKQWTPHILEISASLPTLTTARPRF